MMETDILVVCENLQGEWYSEKRNEPRDKGWRIPVKGTDKRKKILEGD